MASWWVTNNDWGIFPKVNIIKWASYLAYLENDKNFAQSILSSIPNFDKEQFTLQTIEIPIRLFHSHLREQNPQEIFAKVEKLGAEQQHFAAYLKCKNWKNFISQEPKSWDTWQIMTLLPFYYS